jgi:hypothetical protein
MQQLAGINESNTLDLEEAIKELEKVESYADKVYDQFDNDQRKLIKKYEKTINSKFIKLIGKTMPVGTLNEIGTIIEFKVGWSYDGIELDVIYVNERGTKKSAPMSYVAPIKGRF